MKLAGNGAEGLGKKRGVAGWRKEGGRGGRRELGIIAPIDEVTLGGLQRDCEGE